MDVILDSSRYGIPQARKRYFLLAAKNEDLYLKFPEPLDTKVNVKDSFESLPHVDANDITESFKKLSYKNSYVKLLNDKKFWKLSNSIPDSVLSYHKAPKHRASTIERFKLIEPGENLKDLFFKFSDSERNDYNLKKYYQINGISNETIDYP